MTQDNTKKDSQNTDDTTSITVTKNDDATVTLEGEIPAKDFEVHREAAVKKLSQNISIDGFRKGHVPEKILLQNIGEHVILEEMAERALSATYPKLLLENKIDAIGHPQIAITKIAANNPLGFKITTAVMPEFTLPDYKKIAKDSLKKQSKEEPKIEEKEIDTFVENLMRQKHVSEGGKGDDPVPELTDDIAKTLGEFKDVADLRARLKDGMLIDKQRQAKEASRLAVMEALLTATDVALPDVIIQSELAKMMGQFKNDIERMGMKPDEYLKKIDKSEEDLTKEFKPDAEKRAKTQLLLNEIAHTEKIQADPKDIEKEVAHILEHHAGTNPKPSKDGGASKQAVTMYVTTMLTNEKVLAFLENQEA